MKVAYSVSGLKIRLVRLRVAGRGIIICFLFMSYHIEFGAH